jgi:hypothetical protein
LVVFNVYEPPHAAGSRDERAEQLVFVRDGFHWWAELAPALWFLAKQLWLELIAFVAFVAVVSWGLDALGVASAVSGTLLLMIQILIGFEAGFIQAAGLERSGWRPQGTVTGRNLDDCERRFLATWLASQPAEPVAPRYGPSGPQSWAQAALSQAKDAIDRGRRIIGAKA